MQLGRLRAAWDQPLGEVFAAHVEASTWDDDDKNPIDLTEAYLEYRPYPRAGLRSRAAARRVLSTDVAREPRARLGDAVHHHAFGHQLLDRRGDPHRRPRGPGRLAGHAPRPRLRPAVHRCVVRLERSGRHHARGARLRVARPADHAVRPRRRAATQSELAKKELFHEIDDRPGFYVGAQARYLDRAVLNVLHYDNRADPTVVEPELRDFAWQTRFDAAALRIETGNGWTVILQALDGETDIAPGGFWLDWEFDSQSAAARQALGRAHARCALRRVRRRIRRATRPRPAAKTATHGRWRIPTSAAKHWRFALEWLRVESDVPARVEELGEPALASESKVELSARYSLSGSF